MHRTNKARMEFHISREARDRYDFDETLFALTGNVIFANFHSARIFAKKMNDKRDLVSFPEQAVKAAQINAMGLIDEILHYVIDLYRQQAAPEVMGDALEWLDETLGRSTVDRALGRFTDAFPSVAVYRHNLDIDAYLDGETAGVPNRQLALEEMLLLWLANANPAFAPFIELFDDEDLEKQTAYTQVVAATRAFFDTQPTFGPDRENLLDMLRRPAIEVPHSLPGQLEYIRTRWGALLGSYLYRLLSSLDFLEEEAKIGLLGPGPARVVEFAGLGVEPERFSPDRDWMPNLVLIAKNTYVWLDQLSKEYKRPVTRLDQIPDEELDKLARWGFTGLWLIGLWERSDASQRIKQMCGNPDAVASAYSLFSYEIAGGLGGDAAYQTLRDRAWQRGIRLAADMVPNHMGIDSQWVIEHPDWFVGLDYSPFPSYTFNGANLSWDERVGIYLEDHYYDRTDAAVVFKRVDHWTGSQRYIYHGNDGTSMPWNDTAQLDYRLPEVREAATQTILQVARKFSVIRFDAAMTLAKKHYQRLWFPQPGTGGAIPSRADYGMTKEAFDAVFPTEFWREVVDRVAAEVPDTLLLAEAFWLMEGYFVRTLGMHRVYNSAFMNMLRDEENAKYRSVVKNTLEFDPRILKRYVNFMNNPDERTAVDQFGKGDKYFGICTLMATMPGLPMFGHGQVEGFAEKYGMEFQRAYWDERPDSYLVERHERQIFPLLRKRYLFAEVTDFLMYDFYTPDGHVDENVFAYSNQAEGERALVIYHNRYAETRGWIRTSAAYAVKAGDEEMLVQKDLGKGLGLHDDDRHFAIFRDQLTGLEYIRSSRELCEKGLFAELNAYQCQVFLDFREVMDDETHQYAHLTSYLSGRGVPSIEDARREILLQPVHRHFRRLVNAATLRQLIDAVVDGPADESTPAADLLDQTQQHTVDLLREMKRFSQGVGHEIDLAAEIREKLATVLQLRALGDQFPARADEIAKYLNILGEDTARWATLFVWLFTHSLGKIVSGDDFESISRSWLDEWLLGKIAAGALQGLGLGEDTAWRSIATVKLMTTHRRWFEPVEPSAAGQPHDILRTWLSDAEVQAYLGVNRYQGVLWFNKESLDDLLWWMTTLAILEIATGPQDVAAQKMDSTFDIVGKMKQAEATSGYQVERLLDAARQEEETVVGRAR
jgi:glycosidase